jgi:hypothetical protein
MGSWFPTTKHALLAIMTSPEQRGDLNAGMQRMEKKIVLQVRETSDDFLYIRMKCFSITTY